MALRLPRLAPGVNRHEHPLAFYREPTFGTSLCSHVALLAVARFTRVVPDDTEDGHATNRRVEGQLRIEGARTMEPDTDRPDGVALRTFQAYLYTVVIIANGTQGRTVEAELWWNRPADTDGGGWYYFRRYVAKTAEDAVRRVERDFKRWAEGQPQ